MTDSKVLPLSHQQEAVKEHYRSLAPEYRARANKTCEQAYRRLVKQFLGSCEVVLELGSASSDLLDQLGSRLGVACDLSAEMLRMRAPCETVRCVVCAGERLPFADGRFDGLFSINVLEHVSDVDQVLGESARVLAEGGTWLAVTPNGNWEFWLDLAEHWKLKIPEGPHAFLTAPRLREAARRWFDVVEHRTFLLLPAGPPFLARVIDRTTCCSALGWGFFQYIVARKRRTPCQSPVPLRPTSR